jgi:hypothetical protein
MSGVMPKLSEKRHLEPLKVTTDTMVRAMRSLRAHPEWEYFIGLLAIKRGAVIAAGIKNRQPEHWAVLEGFDAAANLADEWASKKLIEEVQADNSYPEE